MKRISLWASPRNISTAMMYAFAQRKDCTVIDEPLYGYYLAHTTAKDYHPGADEILQSMETDSKKLTDYLRKDFDTPIVFFKNMTHHLENFNKDIFLDFENIILTRNPKEMIASFSKVIKHPKAKDLGYHQQVELLSFLIERNRPPLVVDATKFLQYPKKGLQSICEYLKIDFDNSMLSWNAGPIAEDGIWAKYWYTNVHNSTGFKAHQPKDIVLTEKLEEIFAEIMPSYQVLLAYSTNS